VIELVALDLACARAGRKVFEGVGFKVRGGELLAVTGPNGAGKSSLLRLVAGLLQPAGGQVVLRGTDAELTIGEQAHYIGHLEALKPALTVAENLSFWKAVFGGVDEVAGALAVVGLGALGHLPALYLSAGQRRRLSLARLLVAARPIWLLDEPRSNLDAAGGAMVSEIMDRHLAGGGLILAVEHGGLASAPMRELRLGSPAHAPSPAPGLRS
jgi:heme exporter protein A